MTPLEIVLIIVASILGYLIFMVIIGARILRRFVHFPAPSFVGYFLDSSLRKKMQPPDELIKRSGIRKDMTVLEIGCGSGALTTHIARAIGENGLLYALDIQPKMLQQLQRKLDKDENIDIHNLTLIQGSAYDLPFENNTIDLICMITVLQEIPDRLKALTEARRVLKSKGKLAVTELLVDPDYPWKKTTIKMVTAAGFETDKVTGNTLNYTITFTTP